MIAREKGLEILRAINASPRPRTTLSVWNCVLLTCRWQDGVIDASIDELAQDAGTIPGEVYRALSELVKIGALVRQGRGVYALNPSVARFGPVPNERKLELVT